MLGNPPPDPGFGARVRAVADAAGREAVALERAAAAKLGWKPVDDGPGRLTLSHELRAGANLRGRLSCGSGSTQLLGA